MDRVRPRILLIGDVEHREFQEATQWLRDQTDLTSAGTVEEALEAGACDESSWHTVIFAQARPGQFSQRDVQRVSRAIPLAHYVALLGSLCEGDARPGGSWPGFVRVYWYQFLARCRSELQLELRPTSWQLPRTASDPERTEVLMRVPPARTTGLVVVFTNSVLLFDGISAACRAIGLSTVWSSNERRRSFQGAVAAVWDGTGESELEYQRLQSATEQLGSVPVIVLMAFPRYDQVQRARSHGARAAISCPFLLPDLWNALQATD